MFSLTLKRLRSSRVLVVSIVLLAPIVAGCGKSGSSAKTPTDEPPKEPKLRIEGPGGTSFGYSVS
jgi:hypothetical protein